MPRNDSLPPIDRARHATMRSLLGCGCSIHQGMAFDNLGGRIGLFTDGDTTYALGTDGFRSLALPSPTTAFWPGRRALPAEARDWVGGHVVGWRWATPDATVMCLYGTTVVAEADFGLGVHPRVTRRIEVWRPSDWRGRSDPDPFGS